MVHTVQGSQLKTPSWVEAHGYPRIELSLAKEENPNALSANDGWLYLKETCQSVDVHFICGDRHDLMWDTDTLAVFPSVTDYPLSPEKFEIELIKNTKDLVKSVQRVPKAGHLVRGSARSVAFVPWSDSALGNSRET